MRWLSVNSSGRSAHHRLRQRGERPDVARAAATVPVVQIDRSVTGSATDFVGTDNDAGVRMLVDHLVRGPQTSRSSARSRGARQRSPVSTPTARS
jgi:hypothetical protein